MSVTPQGMLVGVHGARPSLVVMGRRSFPRGWGFFVACFGNDRRHDFLGWFSGDCLSQERPVRVAMAEPQVGRSQPRTLPLSCWL